MDEVKHDTQEYPKWVEPHASHVAIGRTIVTPAWEHFHVARDQVVTVLVADADEEARALAEVPKVEAPKLEVAADEAEAVEAEAVEVVEAEAIKPDEVEEPKAEESPELLDSPHEPDDLQTSNNLIH